MGLRKWLRGGRRESVTPDQELKGGLELISPSLLSGWVFHPLVPLVEVRLFAGSHLIAQARIDKTRPDVSEHLGRNDSFGFQLEIPDDLPLVELEAEPEVLALTADGSQRFKLRLLGDKQKTAQLLAKALRPEFRGRRGHFDGLSLDGKKFLGWCYRASGGGMTVWLHAEKALPQELNCNIYRPGMAAQGHSEYSGFCLEVEDWPQASGREVWASFDPEGELLLPQLGPTICPSHEQSSVLEPMVMEDQESHSKSAPSSPLDLQSHWDALESFRRMIDRLESQTLEVKEHQKDQLLANKRSARFRLWR